MAENMKTEALQWLGEYFGIDPLQCSEAYPLAEVENWDSIMKLQLILQLEDDFGIQLSPADFAVFETIGDIAAVIEERNRR